MLNASKEFGALICLPLGYLHMAQDPAKSATDEAIEGSEDYEPPAIAWDEPLEKAGIYAGCAKDQFGEISPGCLAVPYSGGS